MAGGTHVMPRLAPTDSIVSLRRAGLSGIEEGDELRIGATTTLAEVGRRVPFLRSAIESIASPTIRNLATVGGNLFVPQPHGDLAVCLLALDATRGATTGDLVTGVVASRCPERWFYTKAMRRKQNSASIVTVASDGVRIALGGVAPRAGARARGRGGARGAATSTPPPSSPSRPPTRSTTPTPAPGTAAASCPSTSAELCANAV